MKPFRIISGLLFLFIALASVTYGQSPRPIQYTSFDKDVLTLYPYEGRNVTLLAPNRNLNQATLMQIVNVFDNAYDYYKETTGREPERNEYTYNGRATIAVVPSTCNGIGAGCGYMGLTGIELTSDTFDRLYNGVLNYNQYDHVTFYEFGRNFWFYEDKIAYGRQSFKNSIITGYAVFMRFIAIEATGVTPGPYDGTDPSYFKNQVEGLLDLYLADPTLTWWNTLYTEEAPSNSLNLGATDLFASFLFELRARYGNQFVQKIWKEVERRPNAQTTQDAVDNFILAASAAAGENLTTLFVDQWRWPMSQSARREAARYGTSGTSQTQTSCPTGQFLAEYYNNRYLSSRPTFTQCESSINRNWRSGSPGNGVSYDNFSVRWSGRTYIPTGSYTFIARADDGIRVWLDNNLIIDAWRDQPVTEYRATRRVSGGEHTIKVEYYENGGGAVAQFSWEETSVGASVSGTFNLVASHSGKCLDVMNSAMHNGGRVHQWDCVGVTNQLWRVEPVGNYYRIVAAHSGKCLDVANSAQHDGGSIHQWDCVGVINQSWQLVPVGNHYQIVAAHSGKCLDIQGVARSNGAYAHQWQCLGASQPNQLWSLVPQ